MSLVISKLDKDISINFLFVHLTGGHFKMVEKQHCSFVFAADWGRNAAQDYADYACVQWVCLLGFGTVYRIAFKLCLWGQWSVHLTEQNITELWNWNFYLKSHFSKSLSLLNPFGGFWFQEILLLRHFQSHDAMLGTNAFCGSEFGSRLVIGQWFWCSTGKDGMNQNKKLNCWRKL